MHKSAPRHGLFRGVLKLPYSFHLPPNLPTSSLFGTSTGLLVSTEITPRSNHFHISTSHLLSNTTIPQIFQSVSSTRLSTTQTSTIYRVHPRDHNRSTKPAPPHLLPLDSSSEHPLREYAFPTRSSRLTSWWRLWVM